MNIFKSPAFADKCIVSATYRTTGNIYFTIVHVDKNFVVVREMDSTGPIGKTLKYAPALFESIFKNNCTWARYEYNKKLGRYEDLGRSASIAMRLDRYVPKA